MRVVVRQRISVSVRARVAGRWSLVAGGVALAAVLLVGCDDSSGGIAVSTGTAAAPAGATVVVGKVERLPGGTVVVTSDHVLQSIVCEGGVLTLTTSAGVFSGTMGCGQMVGADIVGRFVGKAVVITISDTRLRIEHPDAGSLDFPAAGARAR